MPNRLLLSTRFLLVGASAIVAIWAYLPGLHGGFLFDDFGNLPAIGTSGPINNWATFFRYLTSGSADPTGRPVALLSFLIDARDWPAAPLPFKRTNLLLHIINALLLMLLLSRLGRMHDSRAGTPALLANRRQRQLRLDFAATVAASLWLLHPLFVSTTMYIVQREAMLPATFTLLGLLLWLSGRTNILAGNRRRGLLLLSLGLAGCTLLGVLSKANGILLPALALVIEYTVLSAVAPAGSRHTDINSTLEAAAARTYRRCMLALAWVPTALLATYLVRAGWMGFVHGVSALRPWTMGQRLLTEPRVLVDYLNLLWLPRPFTPGLFNDQIQPSSTAWMPWTTVPSLAFVLALILVAWRLRTRHPAAAAAVLFFFVGQTVESTTLQLELYFEHRNYLPAMLMFWPLSLWLCGARLESSEDSESATKAPTLPVFKIGVMAALLTGLALMTHARASLWGNTHDQALLWAQLNPTSPRAQANAALLEMKSGKPWQAIARLRSTLNNDPDQVQLAFNLIGAHCMLGRVSPADVAKAHWAIAHTRDPGTLLVHWFDSSIEAATLHQCAGLDLAALEGLLDTGLQNSRLASVDGRHQDLLYLKGHIALARHDPRAALGDFDSALNADIRPAAALNQAALLGSAGYPREGLAHLDYYRSLQGAKPAPAISSGMPWLHAWVLRRQNYWPTEIARLRATLEEDAKSKALENE